MAELDFRDYLGSLPHPNSQDWGDRYTPTEAELPLKVQTVTSRQSHDPNQHRQEKPERFEVLDGLLRFAFDHVLLVGKPGSGKSTALQRLRWEEAQKALAAIENRQVDFTIPVLMELRDRRDGSVAKWIQKSLRRVRLDEAEIEELLLAGRFLLLFDGLNELPNSDAWAALDEFQRDQNFCDNPRIFTTRELGAGSDLGIEKKLEMLPLTELQMRQFIENRLPGRAESLLRQLKDRLRELAETPLLLKILCDVVQDSSDGQLPQNRGELFQKEFARRYEKFKPSHTLPISGDSRRFTAELLQHLAFTMIQGDPHTDPVKPTPSWLTVSKTKAEKILEDYLTGRIEAPAQNAKAWLEDLLRFKLLVVKDLNHIEFLHQLFQEYYAAEKLLTLLPTLSDRELKQDYLNYLKWTEAIALTLALVEQETQAVDIVQLGLTVDCTLGARLAGKVKQDFQEKTVELVNALDISKWLKVKLLEKTTSEKAVPLLLKVLETEGTLLRKEAILSLNHLCFALGQPCLEQVIPALLKTIYDVDDELAETTVEILAGMVSKQKIPGLLKALEDENAKIRQRAAASLMIFGFEQAIPSLLKALKDEQSDVRLSATYALQKISSDQAAPLLVKAFEDDYGEVRYAAGEVLDFFKNIENFDLEKVVLELFKVLKHEDPDVRKDVTYALARLGSERAIPGLLELLSDVSNKHDFAINVLLELGLEKALPVLLKVLENSNISSFIRERVAYTFGTIDSDQAVPGIFKALEDHDIKVRRSVVDALALEQFQSERAVPALLKALEDGDKKVRESAAYALGNFKSEGAILGLIKALEDEDFSVCKIAVQALEDFDLEHLIPESLKILEDSEQAIPSLLKDLEDFDSDVRIRAVYALGSFKSESAILGLIKALEDEDFSVCKIAAKILKDFDLEHLIPESLKMLEEEDPRFYEESSERLVENDAHILSNLYALILTQPDENLFRTILNIQNSCQFYNYDISQAAVEEREREKESFTQLPITSNDELYDGILTTIFNSGRNIESSPKEIRGLDEESLRHILIHAVNAKYSNVAEAEAYNKGGKTDILVRINGEKILIAECKIWHGEDGLAKALDQLLQRYVTWRDTKLALLIFSRNQKFSDVVQKIPQEIKQHQYFVREGDSNSKKAWFQFVVCHPDDRDRELTLTILAFDIPS